MRYPLDISPNEDGTLRVSIRNLEGAVTACDDIHHVAEMAMDAFRTAAESYISNGIAVPLPTTSKRTDSFLEIPIGVSAKILLLNEMINQNVRTSDLARLMGTRPQNINRLVKLHTSSKIEHIDAALRALGKSLQLATKPVPNDRNTTAQQELR